METLGLLARRPKQAASPDHFPSTTARNIPPAPPNIHLTPPQPSKKHKIIFIQNILLHHSQLIYRVSQKKPSYKIFGLEIMLFTCSQT